MRFRFLASVFIFSTLLGPLKVWAQPDHPTPSIRVLIGKSLTNVEISGTDLSRKIIASGNEKFYPGRKKIVFNCKNLFPTRQSPEIVHLATIESPTKLLSLNSKKFAGKIHILTTPSHKSCDVVNETDLSTYISSLLSKEMNSSWPVEALKAQAVAARTYALHKIKIRELSKGTSNKKFYDLENSEKHQVSGSFFDATRNTVIATKQTKGEVLLTRKGRLIPIFFHARCGGRTLTPRQVWDNTVGDYKSVNCPYCMTNKDRKWYKELSVRRFKKFLHWASRKKYINNISLTKSSSPEINFVPDKINRKNLRIYVEDNLYIIKKALLRKYFGRRLIPSNNFSVRSFSRKILVSGRGNGHGVGMCQLGALHLAQLGWNYKKILSYYLPKHRLKTIY